MIAEMLGRATTRSWLGDAGDGRVARVLAVVRRAWGEFVGPEAGARGSAAILGVAAVGAAAAPAVVRRRGGASPWDELVAGVLALDLWGGAWANNTRACARWYERPGQGNAEHYRFAALHVHPVLVVWLDRAEPRRVPGWAWAGAHYAYLVVATVTIRRLSRHRRVLGVALTAGGLVLDRVLGASDRAPWFAAAYYPKLLLGHAAAALWSDAALRADGDAVGFHPAPAPGSSVGDGGVDGGNASSGSRASTERTGWRRRVRILAGSASAMSDG